MNFELTEEQRKAIKSLGRAFKKCKDANVVFYMILSQLVAYDGHVVDTISFEKSEYCMDESENSGTYVDTHGFNLESFADDPGMHFIQLKEANK